MTCTATSSTRPRVTCESEDQLEHQHAGHRNNGDEVRWFPYTPGDQVILCDGCHMNLPRREVNIRWVPVDGAASPFRVTACVDCGRDDDE